MGFSKSDMREIVRRQLAIDMNCEPGDFIREGLTLCEARLNGGRRPFERQTPYLEAATMGTGIVVSADDWLLAKISPVLMGKSRDDLFFAPFFYGHSLYYVPDNKTMKPLPCPDGLRLEIREGREIHSLYETKGFDNAILYDVHHPRPDVLVVSALAGDVIVGMAGASADCETLWQIGIDVLPPFRGLGLASCLVSHLAQMILERGKLPYYGTASSNIPSQSVAHRSGFVPAWMCTYKNTFDGTSPFCEKHEDAPLP